MVAQAITMPGMAKKQSKSIVIPIRLPEDAVAKLDLIAENEFSSRSGLIAKIVQIWLKNQPSPTPKDKRSK